MSTPSAVLQPHALPAQPAGATSGPRPEKAPRLVATTLGMALLGLGGVLAWWGGAWGLGGAGAVALAVAFLGNKRAHPLREFVVDSAVAEAGSGALTTSRVGAEVMVETVVPVWSRHMEVTRDAAASGLTSLMNAFANMSGALHTLTTQLGPCAALAEPGAVDQAVRRESQALEALTAASQRAFAERDASRACLGTCHEGLQRLGDLAKRARELARHTRLVAFNASIEANRNRTHADGGSQAVATEARMLSTHMAETGEQIHREVHNLLQQMGGERRQSELSGTSSEELRLEIDLQARKVLTALLQSMGVALQGSAELQQAGQTLKNQLDEAFVHFQFGDRVNQLLAMVAQDMNHFAQWVATHPRATQTDAAEWLAALEANYPMDEQRSSHHGNLHVQQRSGVEFF